MMLSNAFSLNSKNNKNYIKESKRPPPIAKQQPLQQQQPQQLAQQQNFEKGKHYIICIKDRSSSSQRLRKTIAEPKTAIEPSTFWWPVRRSNHWATVPEMVS